LSDQPHVMPQGKDEIRVVCACCAKEQAGTLGDASLDEKVKFTARLPLDEDYAEVYCDNGHNQFVVRKGSERARNFGV